MGLKDLNIQTDPRNGRRRIVGPVYRMVTLPVGGQTKYGDPITEHTPDWARIGYEKLADAMVLLSPKESGHEIEGKVKFGQGKAVSAFTSGGENPDGGDGMIIVRTPKGRRPAAAATRTTYSVRSSPPSHDRVSLPPGTTKG